MGKYAVNSVVGEGKERRWPDVNVKPVVKIGAERGEDKERRL